MASCRAAVRTGFLKSCPALGITSGRAIWSADILTTASKTAWGEPPYSPQSPVPAPGPGSPPGYALRDSSISRR